MQVDKQYLKEFPNSNYVINRWTDWINHSIHSNCIVHRKESIVSTSKHHYTQSSIFGQQMKWTFTSQIIYHVARKWTHFHSIRFFFTFLSRFFVCLLFEGKMNWTKSSPSILYYYHYHFPGTKHVCSIVKRLRKRLLLWPLKIASITIIIIIESEKSIKSVNFGEMNKKQERTNL